MTGDAQFQVLYVGTDGPPISTSEQTSDLIGNAWIEHFQVVAIPVGRLDPDFFRLASGLLGAITQKFVNYQLRLAVVGDISAALSQSGAFADFVREANRGQQVWFVADQAELEARLAKLTGGPPRLEDV